MSRFGALVAPTSMCRLLLLAPLLVTACGNTEIGVLSATNPAIEVQGTVCTDPVPNEFLPLKVLFLIDTSGSNQFTDPEANRAAVLQLAIDELLAYGEASIGVVSYDERLKILTHPGLEILADQPLPGAALAATFTRDTVQLESAVAGVRRADGPGDHHGALKLAREILLQDMLVSEPEVLRRTKYAVILVTDGDPFPVCCSHASDQLGLCSESDNIAFCEDPSMLRQDRESFPLLRGGDDYNQPWQLDAFAAEIAEFEERFQVGEIRLHTSFLFDPSVAGEPDEEGCYTLTGSHVCPGVTRERLTRIAELGDGVMREFSSADDIDLRNYELESLARALVVRSFVARNTNAHLGDAFVERDSDGDGISDIQEAALRTDPTSSDTDSDGFSDQVEVRVASLDPVQPNEGCPQQARGDSDRDGLSDCEEAKLTTDPDRADTDDDGLFDGIETLAGTDPTTADADADRDGDGIPNRAEIEANTNPNVRDEWLHADYAYRTRFAPVAGSQGCTNFTVENVGVVRAADGGPFTNQIRLHVTQSLAEGRGFPATVKTACFAVDDATLIGDRTFRVAAIDFSAAAACTP